MLKRKLVRAGILGQGFMLVTLNLNLVKGESVHSGQQQPRLYMIAGTDTSIVQTTTDSSFAFASDVSVTPAKEFRAAPAISMNRHVTSYVKVFMKSEAEALELVRLRSNYYFRMIDSIFNRYDLPGELKYLAVVESYLKTSAVSRVGAKGIWQFMPQTAKDLGLKVTKKYDERVYFVKSTVAAAKYLRDLYGEFGDWLLVLAAYNGGPGTVYKAINRAGSRNFWALQYFLPAESRNHVKRFIGTHYYFEGKGSITTLTKSEAVAYRKAMETYLAEKAEWEQKEAVLPNVIAVNAITVANKK